MTISEARKYAGARVNYRNPATRVIESSGRILGITRDGQRLVIVRYPEGDHPTHPDNLELGKSRG